MLILHFSCNQAFIAVAILVNQMQEELYEVMQQYYMSFRRLKVLYHTTFAG